MREAVAEFGGHELGFGDAELGGEVALAHLRDFRPGKRGLLLVSVRVFQSSCPPIC